LMVSTADPAGAAARPAERGKHPSATPRGRTRRIERRFIIV